MLSLLSAAKLCAKFRSLPFVLSDPEGTHSNFQKDSNPNNRKNNNTDFFLKHLLEHTKSCNGTFTLLFIKIMQR